MNTRRLWVCSSQRRRTWASSLLRWLKVLPARRMLLELGLCVADLKTQRNQQEQGSNSSLRLLRCDEPRIGSEVGMDREIWVGRFARI